MKTITITLVVSDGVSVGISESSTHREEPPDMVAIAEQVFEQETKPQSSGAPKCQQHGPMTFKEGTNKSGKPYAGWFCYAEGCETKPVWSKTR